MLFFNIVTMLTKYFDNNIELRNRKKKEKITIEDNVEKEMTDVNNNKKKLKIKNYGTKKKL